MFDIPQMLALRAQGRLWRVVVILIGLGISSVGVFIWMWAPVIAIAFDVPTMLSCFDYHSGHVLVCTAFGNEADITGPVLGYVIIPAVAALTGSFVINVVKRFTRAPVLRDAAPILFLRSFVDDQAHLKAHRGDLLRLLMDAGRSPDSVDQLLVYEFINRGPVVALGRPGERRPPFGAQRIYADNATWRNAITALFDRSQTIVLAVNESAGLRWEIYECARRPDLLIKTLFLMRKTSDFDLVTTIPMGATVVPTGFNGVVIGAYQSQGGWVILTSRKPTRITYQIATRHYFQAKPSVATKP